MQPGELASLLISSSSVENVDSGAALGYIFMRVVGGLEDFVLSGTRERTFGAVSHQTEATILLRKALGFARESLGRAAF